MRVVFVERERTLSAMIVDGKQLADDILASLKDQIDSCGIQPRLDVFMIGNNPASTKFVALKRQRAEAIGVQVELHTYDETVSENDLIKDINLAAGDSDVHGIVIQLPLPEHVSFDVVARELPTSKDVDGLKEETTILSPVVGAIAEIVKKHDVSLKQKNILIVGKGKLVGIPVERWLKSQGAHVTSIDEYSIGTQKLFAEADIIVSGVGEPNMIKPDMIKEGVVLLDAGTSESGGRLQGDADPACQIKCSLMSPVPGGVGPVTIAILLKNVVASVPT